MPLFPYDPGPLGGRLAELDSWRTRLDHRGLLPRRWTGRLRRDLEAEAIAASTSMEGVAVTVEEVRRILAGVEAPAVSQTDRQLVEGYRDAMSFVLRRADDDAFRWTSELIIGLHDRVLAGRYDLGAGRVRSEESVFLVSSETGTQVFAPPDGEHVGALVNEACEVMQSDQMHPAIASGWIHVAIAAIHPFRDGNGRAARVLASLAMYRGGFKRAEFTSLEEWWGRHRADYYASFLCLGDRFDAKADVTSFLATHIDAQLHQVRAIDLRERVQRQVWVSLEDIAADSSLPERTANALWDGFFGHDVTAGFYRAIADVSPATATNDLVGTARAGLLTPVGERRGRRYVATEDLYRRVASLLTLDVAPTREQVIAALTVRASG
ncbi:MAG: Fic family protein [Actinomycetota bacterium]